MLNTPIIDTMPHSAITDSKRMSFTPQDTCLDSEPLNIVLVEDTLSDALLARISLDATKIPYRLTTLRKGYQCIKYINTHRTNLPDLVILDLGLPDINGFEIIEHFANQAASIRSLPIAILTAQKHFGYMQEVYPLNIEAYINKPFNNHDTYTLLSRIRAWKDKHTPYGS